VAIIFNVSYINNMSNGEMQMKNRLGHGVVKNAVLSGFRKDESKDEIMSELCHKHGVTLKMAKFYVYKYGKVYAEEIRTKKVKSLMTGQEVEILASTPLACDPSKETYWSM